MFSLFLFRLVSDEIEAAHWPQKKMWGLKCGFDWIGVLVWFLCGAGVEAQICEAAIKPVQSFVVQLCL